MPRLPTVPFSFLSAPLRLCVSPHLLFLSSSLPQVRTPPTVRPYIAHVLRVEVISRKG